MAGSCRSTCMHLGPGRPLTQLHVTLSRALKAISLCALPGMYALPHDPVTGRMMVMDATQRRDRQLQLQRSQCGVVPVTIRLIAGHGDAKQLMCSIAGGQ